MAFGSVGSLATGNHKTSASTWNAVTTTAQLDAGNLIVVVLGTDNDSSSTSDGDNNRHSSVSVGGLSLTKAAEFSNGQGSAAAGVTTSIWYGVAGSNIASGSTITVTLAAAVTAKALAAWEFTIGTSSVQVDGTGTRADDGVDTGSITLSSLANVEHLFIRGSCGENPLTTYTVSTNYTAFTHTSSNTTGGATATNMYARGEHRILTGTSDSTDPTTAASGGVDHASIMVAFSEAPTGPQPASITHIRGTSTPVVSTQAKPASIVHTRGTSTPLIESKVYPASISRTRQIGAVQANVKIFPAAVAHSRAIGDPSVSVIGGALVPASISHTRATSTPTISTSTLPGSVTHSRQIGATQVKVSLAPGSIVHARQTGDPTIPGAPAAPSSPFLIIHRA